MIQDYHYPPHRTISEEQFGQSPFEDSGDIDKMVDGKTPPSYDLLAKKMMVPNIVAKNRMTTAVQPRHCLVS